MAKASQTHRPSPDFTSKTSVFGTYEPYWATWWPFRAEKFDNKFNILRNLELLRVVGANDRNHVVHLVTVGNGVGTDLADVNFQDAQGRQAYHIAIMCIGSEAPAKRYTLAGVVRIGIL